MQPIDRRQALGAIGTISLGGLLAACGGKGSQPGATSAGTTGETATAQPRTASGDGAAALLDDGASCTLTAEQAEGPFYFDADKIRSDIREDRKGARLRLALRVRAAGTCEPISDAVVDIWHADAGGAYSGFDGSDGGGQGGGGGTASTATRYLRGAQVTNRDGIAEFTTIYPGWYPGRTAHIHAKVHLDSTTVLTTQLFFADDVSTRVYRDAPYASRGERDRSNDSDALFDESLVATCEQAGDGWLAAMSFDVRSA